MTVRELIERLSKVDPNRVVVMSKDGEGNGYSPLADFWEGTYWPETTWYGEVREEQPDWTDDELRQRIKALSSELAPYKRALASRERARVKALRPKREKGKVRKVRSAEERERAAEYVAFRELHERCWNCNRRERPDEWNGVWMIERAHITKDGLGKRCEDVRLINALCTRCHSLHTAGLITTERMIRLKREHDPGNYDPEFLQKHSVRRLEFP